MIYWDGNGLHLKVKGQREKEISIPLTLPPAPFPLQGAAPSLNKSKKSNADR
jgi:hypothetical protein